MFKKKIKETEKNTITFNKDVEAYQEAYKDLCNFIGTLDVKMDVLLATEPSDDKEDNDKVIALIKAYNILLDNLNDVEKNYNSRLQFLKMENKITEMGE